MSIALQLSSEFDALKKRMRVVILSWNAARPRADATIGSDVSITNRLSSSRLSEPYIWLLRNSTCISRL